MLDWLSATINSLQESFAHVVEWLERFIIGVPMYVAAPSMVLIGALDSSLLSLPEINDYLVVMRCTKDPVSVFYFPLFAAAGSVIGCMLLYTILRRGGQAVLRRRFRSDHIERVERAYARFGFLALAVPALLPPPMPFKIFVATAGALEYPRWRFMITIMIARSLRYYIEGTLAVFYGERVLQFLKENGVIILGLVAALCLVGLAIYFITHRNQTPASAATAEGDLAETEAGLDAAEVETAAENNRG
ncbi:MAG TPA: VTT domain-containing protein [Pyrinomonadaceae bacterium]|jgi:membrane protein YqaA with SNARE-associated domain|nr:VTT domain-containing protein [Pyrinomonadaceae bacterium]